jgi:HD-GYP domain-containing protein (c-di-GMP phosphodiesterase class II)
MNQNKSSSGSILFSTANKKVELELSSKQVGNEGYACLPIEALPTNKVLPFRVFIAFQNKMVLFRETGDLLTLERVNSLLARGVSSVFVKENDLEHILLLWETSLAVSSHRALDDTAAIRSLLITYYRFIEIRKSLNLAQFGALKELARKLALKVSADLNSARGLLKKYDDPELYFVNHSINVAVYSLVIAVKQKVTGEALSTLAFSASLHNIGNLSVEKNVLYKKDLLSEAERRQMNTHTVMGAKFLDTLNAPKEIILTALQHHERIDGEGYPFNLGGEETHPFSRICAIADAFDALTSVRPYKTNSLTAKEAIKEMLSSPGQFDPMIIRAIDI